MSVFVNHGFGYYYLQMCGAVIFNLRIFAQIKVQSARNFYCKYSYFRKIFYSIKAMKVPKKSGMSEMRTFVEVAIF